MNLLPLLLLVFGYLSGSLPWAVWITRWRSGQDIRQVGSGHATTTNVIRTLGAGWGALVLTLDIAKGFLPVFLSLRLDLAWYWPVLVGVCATAGHIWPLFANLRGGMDFTARCACQRLHCPVDGSALCPAAFSCVGGVVCCPGRRVAGRALCQRLAPSVSRIVAGSRPLTFPSPACDALQKQKPA